MEHESVGHTNCNWYTWYGHQSTGTWTGRLGNKRMSGDHSNDNIIKLGQNTEESPGDLRRLAVSQTLVMNRWLMMVWKTLKRVKCKGLLRWSNQEGNGICFQIFIEFLWEALQKFEKIIWQCVELSNKYLE